MASSTCQYAIQHDHKTPSARNAHFQNCVRKQMVTMGDPKKCRGYMAEIFAGDNPTKDGCTIADIDALCKIHAQNYTVQDAEAYCRLEGAAHRDFWKGHYRKQHPKHYATVYKKR